MKTQVVDQSGLADGVRAIYNFEKSRGKKDIPSLHCREWPCRPKEFSGKEEDFRQWSKKTEAHFAGVIKEPEMMLEWSVQQATEIATTAIDLEFLPMDVKEGRGVHKLEFILQQMYAHEYEANDIVRVPIQSCQSPPSQIPSRPTSEQQLLGAISKSSGRLITRKQERDEHTCMCGRTLNRCNTKRMECTVGQKSEGFGMRKVVA